MTLQVLCITTSAYGRIERKTMENISQQLTLNGWRVRFCDLRSLFNFCSVIGDIFRCKLLVVHSSLAKVYFLILFAALLQKKIVAIIWDEYPVLLNGKRYDDRLIRRVADLLEKVALSHCDSIVVPTSDFFRDQAPLKITVIPFWPICQMGAVKHPRQNKEPLLKFIFSGQINATRDVESCLAKIREMTNIPVIFFLASPGPLSPSLEACNDVVFLGNLSESELRERYLDCDFGLISLARTFRGAGFPSKTFQYVSSGLPCLFYGPPMPSFSDIIEKSGVGLHLDNIEYIDLKLQRNMTDNFEKKIRCFIELTCLTKDSTHKLSELLYSLQ